MRNGEGQSPPPYIAHPIEVHEQSGEKFDVLVEFWSRYQGWNTYISPGCTEIGPLADGNSRWEPDTRLLALSLTPA